MSWIDWARAGGSAAGASRRAARASAEAIGDLAGSWGSRRGVLGPGDAPPPGNAPTDYLDYRGIARPGDLRALEGGALPLGRPIDVRRRRLRRPIGLPVAAAGHHTLVVGPTRAGKTASVIVPWITAGIREDFTVVAVDVKGDLWDDLAAYAAAVPGRRAHRARAARWDYRHRGGISWGWVADLDGERDFEAAAEALLGRERPGDPQPFFHQRDMRMLVALLTLANRDRGGSWTASGLFASLSNQQALAAFVSRDGDPAIEAALGDALGAEPVDYPRVVSGVLNALQPLAGAAMDAVTARDELRLDDLLSRPGLLVCGAPLGDGRLSVASSSLMLRLLTQRVYTRMSSGLGNRLLLVIDEAARVADRIALEELLAVSAGAGCSVVLAAQDLAQFQNEHERSAILANCGNLVALSGCSALTADAVSKRLGDRPEVELSQDRGLGAGSRRTNVRHTMVPVLRHREIMQPPFGPRAAVVHSRGANPKPFLVDLERDDLA